VNGVSMEQLARQWLSEGGVASMTSVIETCRLVFLVLQGTKMGFSWDFPYPKW